MTKINENTIHTEIKNVNIVNNHDSLIKVFEILYRKGLISDGEFHRAISIINEKYRK